jgi:hypothetical protein
VLNSSLGLASLEVRLLTAQNVHPNVKMRPKILMLDVMKSVLHVAQSS